MIEAQICTHSSKSKAAEIFIIASCCCTITLSDVRLYTETIICTGSQRCFLRGLYQAIGPSDYGYRSLEWTSYGPTKKEGKAQALSTALSTVTGTLKRHRFLYGLKYTHNLLSGLRTICRSGHRSIRALNRLRKNPVA